MNNRPVLGNSLVCVIAKVIATVVVGLGAPVAASPISGGITNNMEMNATGAGNLTLTPTCSMLDVFQNTTQTTAPTTPGPTEAPNTSTSFIIAIFVCCATLLLFLVMIVYVSAIWCKKNVKDPEQQWLLGDLYSHYLGDYDLLGSSHSTSSYDYCIRSEEPSSLDSCPFTSPTSRAVTAWSEGGQGTSAAFLTPGGGGGKQQHDKEKKQHQKRTCKTRRI